MKSKNIEVSIICAAYNQEKYIRKALDSFLMQKTNFDYEIVIHDDASTDNTANIIKEYVEKYPNKINAIFEKENMHSQGKSIFSLVMNEAKGKYIATCDGDDYWVYENKLQKQYDALENNKDCLVCVHSVSTCMEDGTPNSQVKPSKKYGLDKTQIIKQDDFAKLLFYKASTKCPFQLSSYFFKREVVEGYVSTNWSIERRKTYDANFMKMFLLSGNIYFINEILSTYRKFSISSISSMSLKDNKLVPNEMFNLINEDLKFNNYTNLKYNNYIMAEVYKYLLNSRDQGINIDGNKELMKKYNLSYFKAIKYLNIKIIVYYVLRMLKIAN